MSSHEIHQKSKIMDVPISKLKLDMSYQRTANQDFIDELARDWDVVKSELILVADRGDRPEDSEVVGGMFIVSGQHRVRAAHKLGLLKITARVMDLTNEEDPAAIEAFYRLGTNRSLGDRSIDAFKAKVRMKDEDALAIVALLKRHNTEINFMDGNMESGINAVSAVEQLYARDQGSILNETLEVIRMVYGDINPKNSSANTMKGVAWFISAHGLQSDRGRLAERMQQFTASQLLGKATQMQAIMGKSKWMNLYFVLVEMYNDKLYDKNKLQINTKGMSSGLKGASGSRQERGRKGGSSVD